jgi:hypothetical protein
MNDIKCYARFLAIYVCKMKKDRVLRNDNFIGESLIESKEEWLESREEKREKKLKKWLKRRESTLI